MHIALVLNGKVEKGFLLEYQKQHPIDFWIAVDGGIRHFTKELFPDLFLGDMDSCNVVSDGFSSEEKAVFLQENYGLSQEKIKKFPCEKDETDSELALQEAISMGAKKITIFGWNGSRTDHVYGNISLLTYGIKHQIPIVLEDKNNRVFLVKEPVQVLKNGFSYLSLFSYSEEVTGLTLRGVKYEVTDFILRKGMVRGISNEITKDEACITMKNGELLVMQSKEE